MAANIIRQYGKQFKNDSCGLFFFCFASQMVYSKYQKLCIAYICTFAIICSNSIIVYQSSVQRDQSKIDSNQRKLIATIHFLLEKNLINNCFYISYLIIAIINYLLLRRWSHFGNGQLLFHSHVHLVNVLITALHMNSPYKNGYTIYNRLGVKYIYNKNVPSHV